MPYDKALALYSSLAEKDTAPGKEWEQKIRSLSYTNLLVFRSFCTLPTITVTEAQSTLLRLQKDVISYEAATLAEYFSTQPGADTDLTWQFLERLQRTNFVTNRVLAGLTKVSIPSAALIFPLIDQVEKFREPAQWAAKALFEVNRISYPGLSSGLSIISTLTDSQNRAAKRLCQVKGINESSTLEGLGKLHMLSFGNSWNSRSIFLAQETTPGSALLWLNEFFILPRKDQESYFSNLSQKNKSALLAAYDNASEKLIWHTNNLHDVTDNLGREIGNSSLKRYSFTKLLYLFTKLEENSQNIYRQKMDQAIAAGDKDASVKILHLATGQARKESARGLTSGNIYVLLALGNDLYDSSFRDILVPVLQQRMATSYENNLLTFILSTDPDNKYSSNFITNLAQKGKLTHFLPKKINRQKKIIDLVAHSAFQDQNSLILFSASFTRLLQLIKPEVRSHLIDIMITAIEADPTLLSSQLRVILQYYIEEHSDLLPPADRTKISAMVTEMGEINIATYRQTPFAEWLKDNTLQSLSVFQRDDDGVSSYFSYCRELIKQGYQPSISKDYIFTESIPEQKKILSQLLTNFERQPKNKLSQLFRISTKMPIVIDWKKELDGTAIIHSIFIYQGKTAQEKLTSQFLRSGHEMFAQRGHSYWRYEQLIAPFEALLKSGELNAAEIWEKHRFLSIGSCGGIKAYRQLTALFRNQVDILATVGAGKSAINNPYNVALFEIIAAGQDNLTWDEISEKTAAIFSENRGGEYLQPGSLPAILHKMIYTE